MNRILLFPLLKMIDISLPAALGLSVLGIAIVFAVLVVLMLAIKLITAIVAKFAGKQKQKEEKA